jgi:hypothetical protein
MCSYSRPSGKIVRRAVWRLSAFRSDRQIRYARRSTLHVPRVSGPRAAGGLFLSENATTLFYAELYPPYIVLAVSSTDLTELSRAETILFSNTDRRREFVGPRWRLSIRRGYSDCFSRPPFWCSARSSEARWSEYAIESGCSGIDQTWDPGPNLEPACGHTLDTVRLHAMEGVLRCTTAVT